MTGRAMQNPTPTASPDIVLSFQGDRSSVQIYRQYRYSGGFAAGWYIPASPLAGDDWQVMTGVDGVSTTADDWTLRPVSRRVYATD
jgi:hypothetical protein